MIIDTKLNTNQLNKYDNLDKYLYVNIQALSSNLFLFYVAVYFIINIQLEKEQNVAY